MSELPQGFETNIRRLNKRIVHEIGDKAIIFDYMNTALYEHGEAFEAFDHITRLDDSEETGMVYYKEHFPELYEELYLADFPRLFAPYPQESDERSWLNVQDYLLEHELEQLEAGSDE